MLFPWLFFHSFGRLGEEGWDRETCADHGRVAPTTTTTLYPLFVPYFLIFILLFLSLETSNWELENSLLEWVGGVFGAVDILVR